MDITRRLNGLIVRLLPVKKAAFHGARPVASITFDDFPKSAWVWGGPVLARHRARATYYTTGGCCGRTVNGTEYYDAQDLKALREAGHEIACHSFAHQPAPTLSSDALAADAARNAEFLKGFLNGEAAASYAFPYGEVSLRTKRFYARRFSNARGVHPGVNDGVADLAQLRAISMEHRSWDEPAIARAIARAQKNRGWIVFYTHEVSDSPSAYGSTPAMLEQILKRLGEARIEILPMREALAVALGEAT